VGKQTENTECNLRALTAETNSDPQTYINPERREKQFHAFNPVIGSGIFIFSVRFKVKRRQEMYV
jgi:hypothetical protein